MNQPHWELPRKGETESLGPADTAGLHATRLAVLSFLSTGDEAVLADITPTDFDGHLIGVTAPLIESAVELNRSLRDPFDRYRVNLASVVSLNDVTPLPGWSFDSHDYLWRQLLELAESHSDGPSARDDQQATTEFAQRLFVYAASLSGARSSVAATVAASLILRLIRMADRDRRIQSQIEFESFDWIRETTGWRGSAPRFSAEFRLPPRGGRFSVEDWRSIGLGFERRAAEIFADLNPFRDGFEHVIELALARRASSRYAPDAASRELSHISMYNPDAGWEFDRARAWSEQNYFKPPQKSFRRFKFASSAPTSLAIHGTWGYVGDWWKPRVGDFHGFAQDSFAPEIYAGNRPFSWSGNLSEKHRETAATMLREWVQDCPSGVLELAICHSFAGDVAAKALSTSRSISQLMLLSSPITYDVLSAAAVGVPTVLVRTKWDLVVLASGFRSRFPKGFADNVREIVLERNYLSHTASHDPAVWNQENLLSRL